MLSAGDVLKAIAANAHAIGTLDGGPCAIQHVSRRNPEGPDERLDTCPCARTFAAGDVDALAEPARKLLELGGGQYVSSPTHTLGDLVRDATA